MKPPHPSPTSSLVQKLWFIYLPFLLISALFVGGYTLLHWLIIDEAGLFSLDEDVVNIWLPFAVTAAIVFVWVRPRVAALRFKRWNRGTEFYCFVAGAAIIAPVVIAQAWLSDAAGGITQIDSPAEIGTHPKTKYYTISAVSYDKRHSSQYTISSYKGRNNETLQIACYFVCPFRMQWDAEPAWLATVYKENISSRLQDAERTTAIRSFVATANRQYEAEDLTRQTYFSRAQKNADLRGLEAALAENPWYRKGASFTLLLRHTNDYASRCGSTFGWVFGSFGIGASVLFLLLLFVPIDASVPRTVATRRRKQGLRGTFFGEGNFLWPRRGFVATPVFIDISLLVFAGMVLAGFGVVDVSARDLLAIGGNFRPALQEGQVWRLLTSMFIHAGLMHLFGNVMSLLFAGLFLERPMGSICFAACFLFCGIAGGIISAVYHPMTVAVGASGGIFGLWGVLLVLGLTKSKHTSVQFGHVVAIAVVTIGYNLLLGLATAGVDNAAHLGGLAVGVVFGVAARLLPTVFLTGAKSSVRRGLAKQADVIGG